MKTLVGALLVALYCAFGEAGAQTWPTRPLRVIVSFAAGSAPDIVCRFATDRLSRAVGQIWFLIVAPTGTPNEIVLRVNREMDRILKDPETVQRLRGLGFFTEGAETPEAVAEAIRADTAKWGAIVKEIGIQPE